MQQHRHKRGAIILSALFLVANLLEMVPHGHIEQKDHGCIEESGHYYFAEEKFVPNADQWEQSQTPAVRQQDLVGGHKHLLCAICKIVSHADLAKAPETRFFSRTSSFTKEKQVRRLLVEKYLNRPRGPPSDSLEA